MPSSTSDEILTMRLTLPSKESTLRSSALSDGDCIPHMQNATEAGPPVDVGRTSRSAWTDEETAFVINFADICLKKEEDFRATIIDEFLNFAKRKVTAAGIERKVRRIVAKHSDVSFRNFLKEGTRVFNVQTFPSKLLHIVQQQRRTWGLGELKKENGAENYTTQSGPTGSRNTVNSSTIQMNCDNRTRDRKSFGKSYRELSVSDSGVSPVSNSTDDFLHAPISTLRVQIYQVQQKNVSGGVQQESIAQSQKRNAIQAEVIDLDSASTPPPKRQAIESASTAIQVVPDIVVPDIVVPATPTTIEDVQSVTVASSVNNSFQAPSCTQAQDSGLAPSQETVSDATQRTWSAPVPKTMPVRDQEITLVQARQAHTPTTDDVTALVMVKDLASLMGVLMREQAKSGFDWTPEVEDRLRCIQRTVKREPGQLLDKVLQDLHSADAAKADLRSILHDLVGRRDFHKDNTFPRVPEPTDIDRGWKTICNYVRDAFGYDSPPEPRPRAVDAGYVAARIDDLAKNRRDSELGRLKQFIEELALHLESPHSVRAVVGALLCRLLFSGPERMCQDVYSPKELKLYKALLLNKDALQVQHFDKLSMKLLFEDEKFRCSQLKPRAERLLDLLELSLKKAWPHASGFRELNDPEGWAEAAVKLKQTLMISPGEYRIHYCMPGSLFDPAWMQAEDVEGFPLTDTQARAKKVIICLFPALAEHEPSAFVENPALSDVLVMNKTFFPTWSEKQGLDTKKVLSKAVVLII